jgi:hypothetical protein
MSVFFSCEQADVWNPALMVARVFIGMTRTMEFVAKTDSGISDIISDQVVVSRDKVFSFYVAVIDVLRKSRSESLNGMVRPYAIVLASLILRIDEHALDSINDYDGIILDARAII